MVSYIDTIYIYILSFGVYLSLQENIYYIIYLILIYDHNLCNTSYTIYFILVSNLSMSTYIFDVLGCFVCLWARSARGGPNSFHVPFAKCDTYYRELAKLITKLSH